MDVDDCVRWGLGYAGRDVVVVGAEGEGRGGEGKGEVGYIGRHFLIFICQIFGRYLLNIDV